MTDRPFFISNYSDCLDQCTPRDALIDLGEQSPISTPSYRAQQIDYYNFLIERECRLSVTGRTTNRTCFVEHWNEQAFMKIKTQGCGVSREVVLVTLFAMYTLTPFILANQTHRPDSCDEIESKQTALGERVCPPGCRCEQERVLVEQEKVFREFTLCPTWTFPVKFYLSLLKHEAPLDREGPDDEVKTPEFMGLDPIFTPIITSLHSLWRAALAKNPDTANLCGNFRYPGHVFS